LSRGPTVVKGSTEVSCRALCRYCISTRTDEWWDGPWLCSVDYEVIFFFSEGRAPFVTVGTVSVEVSFHSRAGDRRVANVIGKGQTSHSTRSPVVEGGGRGREEAIIS
jgi:hypothetical protein